MLLTSVSSFLESSQVRPLGLQVCPKYFFLPCFQELRIPIIKKWVTWESVFITACFHSFLLLFPGNTGLFPQAILLFTRFTFASYLHILMSSGLIMLMCMYCSQLQYTIEWSFHIPGHSLLSVLLLLPSYRVSAILVVESSFLLVPGAQWRGNNGWKWHFPL